jgi:hypothetical protein
MIHQVFIKLGNRYYLWAEFTRLIDAQQLVVKMKHKGKKAIIV